jgi:coenzyme F420 hydrogenase subunit beta
VDIEDQGFRPVIDSSKCKECGDCVKVCPGIEISHKPFNAQTIAELRQAWGPVLELWEGYATDPEIRYKGSSGGVATALALFCLEKEQASGVLHIGANSETPLQNVPVFSNSREELLVCTGSRYSPAAPCEKLDWIENASSYCIFIGKPCDVAALRKSQAVNLKLNEKVGLAISIFCAGTPATKGTYKLLDALGVKPEEAKELRYRGHGWPGTTTVKIKGGNGQEYQMSYEESWGGILSNYAQFRCRLCPDSTGEFADISCGDPWYRRIEPGESGLSLILVRTEYGRKILQAARRAGYIKIEQVEPHTLPSSQLSLLKRRNNIFGRLLVMKSMGIPTPRFIGFSLLSNWMALSKMDKIRSLIGTMVRIVQRNWYKSWKIFIKNCKE